MDILDILLSASFWAAAIRIASPLIFAALGELICERAGVLNLGIEGIMVVGCLCRLDGRLSGRWSVVWRLCSGDAGGDGCSGCCMARSRCPSGCHNMSWGLASPCWPRR